MARERTVDCWRCGLQSPVVHKPATKEESFCRQCLVWLFPEGLLTHGTISNTPVLLKRRGGKAAPQLIAYPVEWQREYVASTPDFNDFILSASPHSEIGNRAATAMYAHFTKE